MILRGHPPNPQVIERIPSSRNKAVVLAYKDTGKSPIITFLPKDIDPLGID